jgi:hypothetical protein|uniref:Uncharacterized protein n=1 Tax=Populus trichocarpa TaxID=3694 RepID=A0A3N7EYH4_POPTR
MGQLVGKYYQVTCVNGTNESATFPEDFFPFRHQVLEHMKRSEIVIRKQLDVAVKNLNVKEIDEAKESFLKLMEKITLILSTPSLPYSWYSSKL